MVVCMQAFRATGVQAQDEGYHGTSDPQLWVYEKQGGPVVGKTSIFYDSTDPVWPADETICVDPARTEGGTMCVDVRDDWPMDEPPLLNFKCVQLPTSLGEHEVHLDGGCAVSFTTVMPPPPSPPPPPPFDLRGKLTSDNPSHIFRKMWDAVPWQYRHTRRPTCFARKRDDNTRAQDPAIYFQDVKTGAHCESNWYEGNKGELGWEGHPPRFTAPSPALLGFDESIDWFCQNELHNFFDTGFYQYDHAGKCVNANHNILSLYGDRVVYNICRNLEWQTCAAQGKLPGQQGFGMRFARKPADLDVYDWDKPLGQCRGWRPGGAGSCNGDGYATDDIFFLEVCLFNQICVNGADLFRLEVGEFYVCQFDDARFDELERILMAEPVDV